MGSNWSVCHPWVCCHLEEKDDIGSIDMKLRLMYSKHDTEKNGILSRFQCEMLILGNKRNIRIK
eukprot:gene235-4481_t